MYCYFTFFEYQISVYLVMFLEVVAELIFS